MGAGRGGRDRGNDDSPVQPGWRLLQRQCDEGEIALSRSYLLQALAAHVAYDEDEARALEQLRSFVANEARCFDRTLPAGHVTGSAWVLDHGGTHVLLTHHRKLGMWLQLGGHAEDDEDIVAVASREAREESGLDRLDLVSDAIFDVDVHAIPARGYEPSHLHYDVRLRFVADRRAPLQASSESRDVAWFALETVTGLTTDASVLRMVRKSRLSSSR